MMALFAFAKKGNCTRSRYSALSLTPWMKKTLILPGVHIFFVCLCKYAELGESLYRFKSNRELYAYDIFHKRFTLPSHSSSILEKLNGFSN